MDPSSARHDTDLPGLMESIWRYRLLVLFVTILGGAAGFTYALQQPPIYEATARMLLTDPRTAGLFGEIRAVADSGRYIRNQAELIRTGAVYPETSELIDGRYSPQVLGGLVQVQGLSDVDLIVVTAWDFTPEGAAEIANAVATAYRTVVREQVQGTASAAISELRETNERLRSEIGQIDAGTANETAAQAERQSALNQIAENESRISQLTVDAALFDDGVDQVAPAQIPFAPARPRPVRTAAIGLFLAFAVAAGFAWWRHGVTRTLQRGTDPAAILQAPLLGEIPEFSKVGVADKLPTVSAPLSTAAEAYQFVVSALAYALDGMEGNTILVTSPTPGDGKTITSLNLAIAARKDGRRVVLVDADWRMRGLTEVCGADPQAGLSNLRSDQVPFEWATSWVHVSEDVRLALVTAGDDAEDPAGYFRTANFRRSLARVKERGELVIVDSPPILAVSETSAIASQVDGIVLVIGRGTPQRLLIEVRRRLDFVGTPVLGYVFNRANPRSSAYQYGDYGYGESDGRKGKTRKDKSKKDKPRKGKRVSPDRSAQRKGSAPRGTWSDGAPPPDQRPRSAQPPRQPQPTTRPGPGA